MKAKQTKFLCPFETYKWNKTFDRQSTVVTIPVYKFVRKSTTYAYHIQQINQLLFKHKIFTRIQRKSFWNAINYNTEDMILQKLSQKIGQSI